MPTRPAPRLLLALLLAATTSFAKEKSQDPQMDADMKAVGAFTLTTALVEKSIQVNLKLAERAAKDPAFRKFMKGDSANGSLADIVARAEKNPAVAAILKEHSLSAKDHALVTMSMFLTMIVIGAEKQGMKLKDLPEGVNQANLKFVKANGPLGDKFAAAANALSQATGDDEAKGAAPPDEP